MHLRHRKQNRSEKHESSSSDGRVNSRREPLHHLKGTYSIVYTLKETNCMVESFRNRLLLKKYRHISQSWQCSFESLSTHSHQQMSLFQVVNRRHNRIKIYIEYIIIKYQAKVHVLLVNPRDDVGFRFRRARGRWREIQISENEDHHIRFVTHHAYA